MSEIEKMYENCNIKPMYWCSYQNIWCPIEDVGKFNPACAKTEVTVVCDARSPFVQYPPFTAEKQLELIKWLGKLDGKLEITCTYNKEKFILYFYFNRKTDKNPDPKYPYSNFLNEDIEILIASLINDIWQDLTEQERTEIADILKG